MPRKSLKLNGFGGGLNLDADLSDLTSRGSEKDEVSFADGLFTDKRGKVHANRMEAIVATDQSIHVGTSGNIVLHDGKLEQHTGTYAMGSTLVYSSSTSSVIDPPDTGQLFPTTPSEDSNGFDVEFNTDTTDTKFIALAKSAESNTYGDARLLASNPSSQPNILDHGNHFGLMFDTNADGVAGGVSNSDYWNKHYTIGNAGPDGDAQVEWNYLWNNSGTIEVNDAGAGSQTYDFNASDNGLADPTRFEGFGFSKWQGNDGTGGLSVRVGTMQISSNSDSQVGMFGTTLDITDHDLVVGIHINSDYDDNLDGFFIVATSKGTSINLDYNVSGSQTDVSKIWYVSADTVDTEGGRGPEKPDDGPSFARIQLPHQAATWVGSKFSDKNVRFITVFPWFTGDSHDGDDQGEGSSLPAGQTDIICSINELTFVKVESIGWLGDKYKIFQTRVNSDNVESLPLEYAGEFDPISPKAMVRVYKNYTSGYKGRLYYQRTDENGVGYGDKFLIATIHGGSVNTAGAGVEWVDNPDTIEVWENKTVDYTEKLFESPPVSSTYTLESGYPEGTKHINATWVTAAVVGRQAYIGNITQNGVTEPDRILKSAIGRPAGFSDKQFIDLDFAGDEIQVIESMGDRLFVFSKNKLTIINVAQDIEYVEATFENYGVNAPGGAANTRKMVCKVGEGIAFVNSSGVYLFDGNQVKDLTQEKLNTLNGTWGEDDDNSAAIAYDHNNRIIIVWMDNSEAYFYSLKSQSWIGKRSSWGLRPHSNAVTGPDGYTYFEKNDEIYYYKPDTSTDSDCDFQLLTGNIDCGDISRRKKFYRIYVTASGGTGSATTIKWSIDGGAWSAGTALTNGFNTIELDGSGKFIRFDISGSNEHATFEVGDMTLIYREKTIK